MYVPIIFLHYLLGNHSMYIPIIFLPYILVNHSSLILIQPFNVWSKYHEYTLTRVPCSVLLCPSTLTLYTSELFNVCANDTISLYTSEPFNECIKYILTLYTREPFNVLASTI